MKIKMFVSVLLTIIIINGVVLNSYAQSGLDYSKIPAISDVLSLFNVKVDLERSLYLKDADRADRYIYIPLIETGYIIYDIQLEEVIEFSVETANSYIESARGDELYYTGPLSYYKIIDGTVISLKDHSQMGTIEVLKEIEGMMIFDKQKSVSQTASIKVTPRSIEYIRGTVPNYSYNPDGICGATAAAMLLKWRDNYMDSRYVPASLTSGDGELLIRHLANNYIPKKSGSVNVVNGIYDYVRTQGISYLPSREVANITSIVTAVSGQGVPYILGITGHPQYKEHWVTGYGYSQPSSNTIFAIVNDGWGSTGIQITMSYTDWAIY
ncbi:MAG: hypothetical protein HFI64_14375 [Lachnospiraceae bacterium]|nr:hypothetical protein [Lachnospiraceae bacterium]